MKSLTLFLLFFFSSSIFAHIFSFGFRNDGFCVDLPHNLFLQVSEAPKQKLLLIDLKSGNKCYAETKRKHDCPTGAGNIIKVTSLRPFNDCSKFKKGIFLAVMKGKAQDIKVLNSEKAELKTTLPKFVRAIRAKKGHGKDCKQVPCTQLEKDIILHKNISQIIKPEGSDILFIQHQLNFKYPSDKPESKAWDTGAGGVWTAYEKGKITVLDGGSLCNSQEPLFFKYKDVLHFYLNSHCCNCGWSTDWLWKAENRNIGSIYSDSALISN